MEFTRKSAANDPVVVFTNKEGTMKIWKRGERYELKEYSLFNMMGTTLGSFVSWESVKAYMKNEMGIKATLGQHH